MESVLIWHKPTEPVPADVEVLVLYLRDKNYVITNFVFHNSGEKKDFAGFPLIAWAELNIRRTAEMIMENFNKEWLEFLHQNATTK